MDIKRFQRIVRLDDETDEEFAARKYRRDHPDKLPLEESKMSNLTTEQIINWLASNLSTLGMAELLDAIEVAGDRAAEMVEVNPTQRMLTDELIFDEFFYELRDHLALSIETWSQKVSDGSGVEEWYAARSSMTMRPKTYKGETEIQAIIALLKGE